jgi:uncharacterized protein YciI
MRDMRFVIVHTPGPKWKAGFQVFDQDGVHEHVDHYRKLLEAGKLTMGGPFLDACAGGMMIVEPNLTEAEIVEFANADPAVMSGLLKAEVRQWLVGMSKA